MPGYDASIALTEDELREIRACLDAGTPLPDKYRFRLFAGSPEPLLFWEGKTREICWEVHPLLVREEFARRQPGANDPEAAADAWRNLLIRGDNRLALSSLLHGPLRRLIEENGGIKLMYIDPPFAVGADFTMAVAFEAQGNRGRPRALAYRDSWEQGLHSFLRMIHERLLLMRNLLAEDGSLYLHCDWRLAPHMRLVLDEVFGAERFLGDIVWHYTGGGRSDRYFSRKHDRLLHYAASRNWIFNVDAVRVPYKPTSGYAKSGITSAAGRHYSPNPLGTPVDDVWDIPMVNPMARERLDYPTQKPEALLQRIVRASSRPGDLVADFFCGSGTLAAVAESLGRKWLAVDASPLAVHTTRKRLMGPQASPPSQGQSWPFLLVELDPGFIAAPDGERYSLDRHMGHPSQASCMLLPDAADPARIVRYEKSFRHEAEFLRQSLVYTLAGVRLSIRNIDDRFVLALGGFSVSANGEPASGGAAASFFSLLRQEWTAWLDYWSIGLRTAPERMPEGMAAGPLCNRILWHSARARKGTGAELRSPPLKPPLRGDHTGGPPVLIVTIVDIFANESQVPLLLAPE